MTLKELQAEWREKAAGYRQFSQAWLDSLKAQGIPAPAYIHDECADALTPFVAREALLDEAVKAAQQVYNGLPHVRVERWNKLRKALSALEENG